ncbi:MAG: S9 family peptidase [Phycisphaerales bacterium]|nr:S9 family peptidase [Phycisphaerales bacterium]
MTTCIDIASTLLLSLSLGQTTLTPPIAQQIPFVVKSPQGERIDEYYWLRDDDSKAKRPEILAYLNAENAYTEAATTALVPLQNALLAEMRGRIKEDDQSPADFDHGYWYSTRFAAGAEYPIYQRQRGTAAGVDAGAPVEVMLDGPALAAGKPFYSIGATEVSADNQWLAWSDDVTGRRISTLRFKNLATGAVAIDAIPGVLESVAWSSDNKTIFYIKQDPVLLQTGPVYRHVIGTDPAHDALVYEEPDDTLSTSVELSTSRQRILIVMEGFDTTEYRAIAADRPADAPTMVLPRTAQVRSYADHFQDRWIIRTNDSARNFRVVEAPEDAANDRTKWKEIIPNRPTTSLDRIALFDGAIAVQERADANSQVRIVPFGETPALAQPRTVATDESAFAMQLGTNSDPAIGSVRVNYTSMITPRTVFDVDLSTGAKTVRKVQPVIGYDKALYDTARAWATSRDGKQIPVSLAWRTDRYEKDGSAPIYQEGYGAYGISSDAEFSSNQVSLMDRGFLLATAHVRGGADLGQDWYEGGRLGHKKNTFNDFEDVTDYLVAQKYGARDRVFATGGSAGGLLMGVIANQAGQKYRGIGLHVPFVDALTTMLDETIPLTTNEWTQWGDPREAAAYAYIGSYSPYDNIARKAYPAMLVTTGLWDSQVQYFEPAKYVARLRAMRTDGNKFVFRINMAAGHGGNSGRFERLKQIALEYAFFIDLATSIVDETGNRSPVSP